MYSAQELLEITEREIAALPLNGEPNLLYEPIRYALEEGGKRLRPLLLLLTSNLYKDDIAPFVTTAIGVEMFHNFTLLHDDIMDNSPTRRGRDSVPAKWGNNVAILSGDAMLIYAYGLILGTHSEHRLEVTSIFNRLSLDLCEGQQIDMDFESRDDVSMSEYMEMIRLKTSVLIAGAMEMGAVLGGATDSDKQLIYNFGLNVGAAFQIQDDVLDLYASCPAFGKPIGGDIIEGKKSFISLLCLELASEEDKKILTEILTNKDVAADERVLAARKLFDKYSVRETAEELIRSYFDDALAVLEQVSVPAERKSVLIDYIKGLIYRNR